MRRNKFRFLFRNAQIFFSPILRRRANLALVFRKFPVFIYETSTFHDRPSSILITRKKREATPLPLPRSRLFICGPPKGLYGLKDPDSNETFRNFHTDPSRCHRKNFDPVDRAILGARNTTNLTGRIFTKNWLFGAIFRETNEGKNETRNSSRETAVLNGIPLAE